MSKIFSHVFNFIDDITKHNFSIIKWVSHCGSQENSLFNSTLHMQNCTQDNFPTKKEIQKKDSYSLSEAAQNLHIPKKHLISLAQNELIYGCKKDSRWMFSKDSIDEFPDRYIDIKNIADISGLGKRRIQQIIKDNFPSHAKFVGNKIYVSSKTALKIIKENHND